MAVPLRQIKTLITSDLVIHPWVSDKTVACNALLVLQIRTLIASDY